MTGTIGDQGLGGGGEQSAKSGPDPVIGAGVTLFGVFLMGTGGARDAHYVFDAGVLIAVIGAGVFVLSVALSAMRMENDSKT